MNRKKYQGKYIKSIEPFTVDEETILGKFKKYEIETEDDETHIIYACMNCFEIEELTLYKEENSNSNRLMVKCLKCEEIDEVVVK